MSPWRTRRAWPTAVSLAQVLLAAGAVALCVVPTYLRVPDRFYTEAGGGFWLSFRGYPVPWVEHRQVFTWRPNDWWGVTDVILLPRQYVGCNPLVPAALLAVAVCLPPVVAAVGATLARRVRRQPASPLTRPTRAAGAVLLGAAVALAVAALEFEVSYQTGYTPWSRHWPGSQVAHTEAHREAIGYARRWVRLTSGNLAERLEAAGNWGPRVRLTLAAFLAATGAGCIVARPWRRGDVSG